jgi:hypothetical protein
MAASQGDLAAWVGMVRIAEAEAKLRGQARRRRANAAHGLAALPGRVQQLGRIVVSEIEPGAWHGALVASLVYRSCGLVASATLRGAVTATHWRCYIIASSVVTQPFRNLTSGAAERRGRAQLPGGHLASGRAAESLLWGSPGRWPRCHSAPLRVSKWSLRINENGARKNDSTALVS